MKWHPHHETCLVSGGFNGSLTYWVLGHEGPHTVVGRAHNYSVNVLEWHPLGHVLATAANDGICKFWCREPPGSQLINDGLNPMFVEASTPTAGLDPLATIYGPAPQEVVNSVLPDVSIQTNQNTDAIAGSFQRDDSTSGSKFRSNQGNQYQGRNTYQTNLGRGTGSSGRGRFGNQRQGRSSDSFETSSVGSASSYGSRGTGRSRPHDGGSRMSGGGSTRFQQPPPPPTASYYGPASGATPSINSRTASTPQDGRPQKRSRFSD